MVVALAWWMNRVIARILFVAGQRGGGGWRAGRHAGLELADFSCSPLFSS